MRARARLSCFSFEQELFIHVRRLEYGHPEDSRRRRVARSARPLTQIAPIFVKQKYMLGEEFSMLDVAIAPLLWRLDHYGIQLNKQCGAAAQVRRAALLPPGLHRGADALRKGDAALACGKLWPMADVSTKPYFIRAIYEWCSDCGYTPYLSVRVDERTRVPMEYVKNGEIVLNVSLNATRNLTVEQRADPVLGALQRGLPRGEHPRGPRPGHLRARERTRGVLYRRIACGPHRRPAATPATVAEGDSEPPKPTGTSNGKTRLKLVK